MTDGDPEAEAQIIGDIRKSIEEYLEMIGDGSDPERVAKAAHKALPLLEMLEPGKNQWVAPLQTPGGALVSARLSPLARARSAPTKQQHPQSEEKNILVGALETSAPPGETTTPPEETSAPPEETTTPPNEQERERLTKQLIEKLKEILCDIY